MESKKGFASLSISKDDLSIMRKIHVAYQYNTGKSCSLSSFVSKIVKGMNKVYENDKSLINQSMTIDLRPQKTSIAS